MPRLKSFRAAVAKDKMPLLDHEPALVTQALARRAAGVCAVPAGEHAGRAGAAGWRRGRARGRHGHAAWLRSPGPGACVVAPLLSKLI